MILLGEFGRPRGLKGELRLKSFTAEPQAIAGYGPLQSAQGRRMILADVRPSGTAPDLLIAKVEGVATREAAEALSGVRLYVERERLAGREAEDEFLVADLIGTAALDPSGRVLGTVVAVPNYGGGELLEIAPPDGGASALVPFTKSFVPVVDLTARRIVVDAQGDLFAGGRT